MMKQSKTLEALEDFLADSTNDSLADTISDLEDQGVDVPAFMDRVNKTVEQAYLKKTQEIERSNENS